MKTSFTLLSLAVVLVLTSCEKKYCFDCTTVETENETTIIGTDTSRSSIETEVGPSRVCEMTDDDANDYEAQNSAAAATTTLGATTTETTKTTTCTR